MKTLLAACLALLATSACATDPEPPAGTGLLPPYKGELLDRVPTDPRPSDDSTGIDELGAPDDVWAEDVVIDDRLLTVLHGPQGIVLVVDENGIAITRGPIELEKALTDAVK